MQSRYNGDAKNGKIKIGLGNHSNRDEARVCIKDTAALE